MNTIKILFGFLPGVTMGMWLRAMWFCVALCLLNPTDDYPLWFVGVLLLNLAAAGVAVVRDRERWKRVHKNLNAEEDV